MRSFLFFILSPLSIKSVLSPRLSVNSPQFECSKPTVAGFCGGQYRARPLPRESHAWKSDLPH